MLGYVLGAARTLCSVFGCHKLRTSLLVPVFALSLLAFVVLANELLLKNLIRDPRPPESLATSYGLPSGHTLTALVTFAYFAAESVAALDVQTSATASHPH